MGDGAYKWMAVNLLGRIIFPNVWYIAINAIYGVDRNAYEGLRGTKSILVEGISLCLMANDGAKSPSTKKRT